MPNIYVFNSKCPRIACVGVGVSTCLAVSAHVCTPHAWALEGIHRISGKYTLLIVQYQANARYYNVYVKGISCGIIEKNHYIGHALRMQIIFHDMGGISPAKKHGITLLKKAIWLFKE